VISDFVRQIYPTFKQANPTLPILVREAAGIRPAIYARYEFGRERKINVDNMTAQQIEQQIKALATPE
jgi:NADH dehydrogenase (ubiquinone) 1 alpha subcomplex subunit 2